MESAPPTLEATPSELGPSFGRSFSIARGCRSWASRSHEGTISKWLVKPGDKVVEYEPMLDVDTDKVFAEVPAPMTGS